MANNLQGRRGEGAVGLLDEGSDDFFVEQVLFVLTGEEHKFPTSAVVGRRNGDGWAMWITEELDDRGGLLIGKAVDDEPFLGKGCAMHGNVEEVADGAAASITGE